MHLMGRATPGLTSDIDRPDRGQKLRPSMTRPGKDNALLIPAANRIGVSQQRLAFEFEVGVPLFACDPVLLGTLGEKLFTMQGGSDGMCVDVKGNVYTTHGGRVNIFNAHGKKLEQINVPERPANVCFGGDDFRTLFITARTSLYSIRMKHPGAKSKSSAER